MARPHIDLDRRQDQPRHVQRLVPLGPHFYKFILTDPVMSVNIALPLLGNGGLPDIFTPALGQIVMAHEEACCVGQ